jgi:hypothetical protein
VRPADRSGELAYQSRLKAISARKSSAYPGPLQARGIAEARSQVFEVARQKMRGNPRPERTTATARVAVACEALYRVWREFPLQVGPGKPGGTAFCTRSWQLLSEV